MASSGFSAYAVDSSCIPRRSHQRRRPIRLSLCSMVPPWIVTCSCGWVSAAETLDELLVLVDLHKDHASAGRRHAIVVRGTVNLEHVLSGRRRPSA
jgi:hypothetical protein